MQALVVYHWIQRRCQVAIKAQVRTPGFWTRLDAGEQQQLSMALACGPWESAPHWAPAPAAVWLLPPSVACDFSALTPGTWRLPGPCCSLLQACASRLPPAPLFLFHLLQGPLSLPPAALSGAHCGLDCPPRAQSFQVCTPATASVHFPVRWSAPSLPKAPRVSPVHRLDSYQLAPRMTALRRPEARTQGSVWGPGGGNPGPSAWASPGVRLPCSSG